MGGTAKAEREAKTNGTNGSRDLQRRENAIEQASRAAQAIVDEAAKVIVGKTRILELVMIDVIAGGHILFEDYPGLGKTLLSNTFAQATGCDFGRVQFTPDVLPGDITGSSVYNKETGEFEFRSGPIFANFLLADEINRAPPKTQSSLLEAMAETQVSVEGSTHQLPSPFLVFATQNPVEQEGTYPLPEAQMDRFMMKLSMGYPSRDEEKEILSRRVDRGSDDTEVRTVASPQHIVRMQELCERIRTADPLLGYISDVVDTSRRHAEIEVGSSPRGSLALLKAARARALLDGRAYATPDDVKAIAPHVLAHRIILTSDAKVRDIDPHDVVADLLGQVPTPRI
jgi:MoxR-like ATPase